MAKRRSKRNRQVGKTKVTGRQWSVVGTYCHHEKAKPSRDLLVRMQGSLLRPSDRHKPLLRRPTRQSEGIFMCAPPAAARKPSAERNEICRRSDPGFRSALRATAPPGANTNAALAPCIAQNRRSSSAWLRATSRRLGETPLRGCIASGTAYRGLTPTAKGALRQAQGRLCGSAA